MADFEYWAESCPIADLLVRGAHLHPTRAAIVLPEARRTYRELLDGAVRVAQGLLAAGVRPRDHVGMFMTNSLEFVEGFFGITLLGCVVVPLNARHKAAELGYIINNAELTALLTAADDGSYLDYSQVICESLPSLAQAANPLRLDLPEAPQLRVAILLRGGNRPGFLSSEDFMRLAAPVAPSEIDAIRQRVRLRDIAAILYTSGTTANPKGCMLTHEAMTRGPTERARHRLAVADHNVHWGAGPLFHIGSLAPFIGAISVAGTYLTDVFFDPGRALELMYREGVTNAWPWFPAIVQGLLDHPSFDSSRLQSLKTLLMIGPKALVERVQAALPHVEVMQACGMTETAGIFAIADPQETPEVRAVTHGKPSPGVEIRIRDVDTGEDAKPGEVGEILVRGYCVMEGYYRDPEKTAATLDADGWLHTGDLYARNADGNLVFNGRLKDMLKVGGENVAAIEVEAFLCEHPAVRIAEVVGRPDPRLDEVPVAFVELHPDHQVTAEELIEFCKGKIANYKIPRAVYFMKPDEWPMSATKVNKPALRQRVLQEMGLASPAPAGGL